MEDSKDLIVKLAVQAHFERRDKVWIGEQVGQSGAHVSDTINRMRTAGTKIPALTREQNTSRGYEPARVARWNKIIEEETKAYKERVLGGSGTRK